MGTCDDAISDRTIGAPPTEADNGRRIAQERRPSRKRSRLSPMAPWLLGVLAAATLIVAGMTYLSTMRSALWRQTVEDTLEITSQNARAFQVYLTKDVETIEVLGASLEKCASTDLEGIRSALGTFDLDGDLLGAVNLRTGELIVASEDATIPLSEESLEEYRSLSGSGVLEPRIGDYTGLRVILYYHAFTFADGTPGLVYEGVPTSTVAKEFTMSFFDEEGFSYVVNDDGDILVRSRHRNSNHTFRNIFEVLAMEGNDAALLDEFRASLAGNREGAIRLTLSGKEYVFAYVPIAGTKNWDMVSIIPDDAITSQADTLLDTSTYLLLFVAVAIGLALVYTAVVTLYRRRVKAEQKETAYREKLFNTLATTTDDVFLMLSLDDRRVEYVSPNVERLIGIPEDAVRKSVWALPPVGDERQLKSLRDIPPGGSLSFSGQRSNDMTGERRWFSDLYYRTEVGGEERAIVVLSDRTLEHRNEAVLKSALDAAEAANASKSTFLSNMSHDIRTPMNAVMGLTRLLERDAGDKDAVLDHTRQISASSQHLLSLINDVLDMSKIESGAASLNLSEVDVASLAEDLSTILAPQAQAKNQTFVMRTRGLRTETVVADRLRLNQVLLNLLGNAVKYTPEGGRVCFEIQQLPSTTPGAVHLRFVVTDNGIGMAPEFVDHVFEPFSREVNSTTNRVPGTGLGMAITKNLVDLMGGLVKVESKPGVGSTFTVDLDLREPHKEDTAAFFAARGIRRALVVDDNAVARAEVTDALRVFGVAVEGCASCEEAVEAAQRAPGEKPWDLVILDWKMPGMTGSDCAQRLRSILEPDVPIIILSAYDANVVKAREHGADGFMSKPFFMANLRQTLVEIEEGNAEPEGSRPIDGLRFLAAEDNALSASILEELLDMEGATVDVYENGKLVSEAFAASEPGQYDAVLLDVQMPVMNGLEAARAMRACSHPEAQTIPIIALTANAFADDVRATREAGMDAHMAKPVQVECLGDVLEQARENRREALK